MGNTGNLAHAGNQLLGFWAEALVGDPEVAYTEWQKWKKTELWDKKKQMWRTFEPSKKTPREPGILVTDQLLENILVAVFEKLHDRVT